MFTLDRPRCTQQHTEQYNEVSSTSYCKLERPKHDVRFLWQPSTDQREKKKLVIDAELTRLNLDVAALQETRLADEGSVQQKQNIILLEGKESRGDRRIWCRVCSKDISCTYAIETTTTGSERLLLLRRNSDSCPFNLLTCYGPTLTAISGVKDWSYNQLDSLIRELPQTEVLLGCFNARIGAAHNNWSTCIGHFGVGNMDYNGQKLLKLCCAKRHAQLRWKQTQSRLT